MTDTAVRADQASREHPAHPLAPATAAEYLAGREVMAAAGLLTEPVRFAYYGLEEPPKDEVLASAATDRRLRAFLVNCDTGESTDVVVSLTHREIVSARRLDPGQDGQMPILDSDFAAVDEITKADPTWRAAMARRGYDDVSQIRTCPITAGAFGSTRRRPAPDGAGARVRPGRRARPGLGASRRRRRRLRGPDRQEGLQGHRRVRAPGTGRIRRLRRRGRPRPAPDHAQAHRDHPAGGPELHPGRLRAALAGLVDADRLRRPRGADPAPGQPARGRRRAACALPGVDPGDGRALRRPELPLLAGATSTPASTWSASSSTRSSSAATAWARSPTWTPP